jgi:flavodoxin
MKTLIIFDSNFGNTKKIAEIIAEKLGKDAEIKIVSDFKRGHLEGVDFLIVGSPIIGWRPTEKIMRFLGSLDEGCLNGMKSTAFDTRVKLFIHGDAMNKINKKLKDVGADVIEPRAFYVSGKEGPLLSGETEKAMKWAGSMILNK